MTVADILYLTPEGAPQVFLPPPSALAGANPLPDRKGYNFDGCAPETLLEQAEVRDGRIIFPGGSSYRLLVLPAFETMTPSLLDKITSLVEQGATLVGAPPLKSPSLSGYPACDREVRVKAETLWGSLESPVTITDRQFGKGRVFWGGGLTAKGTELYPSYEATASLLRHMGTPEDFESIGPIRYTHRRAGKLDIYFVANRTEKPANYPCTFRVDHGLPELWDPLTGDSRTLPEFSHTQGRTILPLSFEPFQSYFVVFRSDSSFGPQPVSRERNFVDLQPISELNGSWAVSFDPKWGGPKELIFEKLEDWATRVEPGIKYFSGIATYRKVFDLDLLNNTYSRLYLQLGKVNVIARIRLNKKDLGVLWCDPWRVDITDSVKAKGNQLEIDVANLWANRLIGDQQPADKDTREVQWSSGLLEGKTLKTGRYTFSTRQYYKADSPLQPSGLLGPVQVLGEK